MNVRLLEDYCLASYRLDSNPLPRLRKKYPHVRWIYSSGDDEVRKNYTGGTVAFVCVTRSKEGTPMRVTIEIKEGD